MAENSKKDFIYVKQIDPNYCGPACVEMLLWYYGLGQKALDQGKVVDKLLKDYNKPLQKHLAALDNVFKSQTLEQSGLDTTNERWKKWVTRPDEIVNMIHGFQIGNSSSSPSPLSELWYNFYCLSKNDHEVNRGKFLEDLERRVKDPDQPPIIIPIHDASHWVVICEMADDGKTFIGKDPLYFGKTEKISPFGITSLKGTIKISNKPQNFSNPINLLMIERHDDPEIMLNIFSRKNLQPISIPISPSRDPGTPMTPAAILEIVRAWLIQSGGNELKGVGRRSSLFNLSPPLLVRRADRENYDYYLVAVKNNNGEVTQLIRLDAITGEYLDSIQMDPTVLKLELSPNDISAAQASNARQSVSVTQASTAANLMWQPSVESQSAFFPFHQTTEGGATRYRRIDGRTFDTLTPLGPMASSKNDSISNV